MRNYWITGALFIGSGLLYIAGFSGAGVLALVGGVTLEVVFWVRLVQGRRRAAGVH